MTHKIVPKIGSDIFGGKSDVLPRTRLSNNVKEIFSAVYKSFSFFDNFIQFQSQNFKNDKLISLNFADAFFRRTKLRRRLLISFKVVISMVIY